MDIPRIKGVFNTPLGWYSVNKMRVTLSKDALQQAPEEPGSRVEMIHTEAVDWDAVEARMLSCLVK